MTVFDRNLYGYGHKWAEYMGISVWAFNQLAGAGELAPLSEAGKNVWVLPDWRDLSFGITRALRKAVEHLHFYPRPVFLRERIRMGKGYPYQLQSLRTRYGYIQAIGSRALTELELASSVTYTDEDGDGVDDTGTVSFIMADTPPAASEIQMFFTTTDIDLQSAVPADERYQIEPATVTVSGNTVTLSAHIAYFVQPSLWRQPYLPPNYNPHNKNILTTTDMANYVTEVDVYRVYPNATGAVKLLRDPIYTASTPLNVYEEIDAVALIEDSRLGLFKVRETACNCLRGPYAYVDISYFAGYPIPNYSNTSQADVFTGDPEPALTEMLVRLANCEQARESNTYSNAIATRWVTDNKYAKFEGEVLRKTPFGSKIGQQAAWDIAVEYALGRGMALA